MSVVAAPYWLDLGDVSIVPLVERQRLLIEPGEFFPELGVGQPLWCFEHPWYDADTAKLVFTIQSFMVVAPEMVVLIDACVGAGKSRVRPEFDKQQDDWLARFRATGMSTTDVDSVVFTHFHVDHVGWATSRAESGVWTPVFENARHYVTEPEFQYWTSAEGASAMERTGNYTLMAHGVVRGVQGKSASDLGGCVVSKPASSQVRRHFSGA